MPTDVVELTTFYAAAGYTFPTSIPNATFSRKASSVPGSASSTPSSGPGPGPRVGIAIGVTLSVVVCGACAILLHLSMRRRQRRQQQQNDVSKELASPVSTLVHGHKLELEDTPARLEMECLPKVHELPDDNR
ncbi:MAG: hypothetical protein Q9175_001730 [Cornicularia normoerica]